MISQQAIAGLRSVVLQSFERVAAIGAALATRFGLPTWQMTQTATDANRSCLRLARAISGRSDGLVFNGCYHGTVDETLVCLENGKMRSRAGSRGPPGDAAAHTRVIEFNDEQGLRQTLASGKIAAVLCEPALTNMGMVLPLPGFHQTLRRLTREHGTLLIIDETAHAVRRTAVVAPDVMDLSPTCWSAARPLPAVCPARFTALLTRCAHASTPCRRMPNTVIPGLAPRYRQTCWRWPLSKPVSPKS